MVRVPILSMLVLKGKGRNRSGMSLKIPLFEKLYRTINDVSAITRKRDVDHGGHGPIKRVDFNGFNKQEGSSNKV